METIRNFMREYLSLALLLLVFSYLAPEEKYKKYLQFFIGILLSVFVLKPVLGWMQSDELPVSWEEITSVTGNLKDLEYEQEGENIFELFFMEEDTESD
jgi:uncharacterized membrane protein YoaK (UPF0700 family)